MSAPPSETRTHLSRILALCLSSALCSVSLVALAQDGEDEGPSAREEADAPDVDDLEEDEMEAIDDAGAEADVVEEGGEKVKVFRFSGLDISGRLKSPQLLYFLNRLRAEFDRPRLPHRSFMPELVRSSKSKAF